MSKHTTHIPEILFYRKLSSYQVEIEYNNATKLSKKSEKI